MKMPDQGFNPVISIVTVVYNNKDGLNSTIQSVINQSYPNIEYIIIDGGSKDGTLDIIRQFESKISYWVSEKDKGIYDAMNKGLKAAKGDYILFLNSGDLLADETVLSKIFGLVEINADCYYGETYLIDGENKILGTRSQLSTRKLPVQMSWKDMINGMVVSHQSVLFKRTLVGEYNLNYKCSSDIDWVISALKNCKKVVNTRLVISRYLIGGFSISNQKKCWQERFKIYNKHYGIIPNLMSHIRILTNNLLLKLSGKRNY